MERVLFQNGTVTALYKDGALANILAKLGGKLKIERASHIEAPKGELSEIAFEADLSPSGGPVLKGFKTYKEAVDAEVQWLQDNILTTNKTK